MDRIYEKLTKCINKLNKKKISNNYKYNIIDKIETLKIHFKSKTKKFDKKDEKFIFINKFFENFKYFKKFILKNEEFQMINMDENNENIENIKNIDETDIIFVEFKNNDDLKLIKKYIKDIKEITQNINTTNYELNENLNIIEKNYGETNVNLEKSKKQLVDAYIIHTKNRTNKIKTIFTGMFAIIGGVLTLGNPFGIAFGSAIGYKIGFFFKKKMIKKSNMNIKYL